MDAGFNHENFSAPGWPICDVSHEYIANLLSEPVSQSLLQLPTCDTFVAELKSLLDRNLPPLIAVAPEWIATPILQVSQPSTMDTPQHLRLVRAIQKSRGHVIVRGSEGDFATFIYMCVGNLWNEVNVFFFLAIRTMSNKVDISGVTAALLTPDFMTYINNALVFTAEHKASEDDLKVAVKELQSKVESWRPMRIQRLPFLPCYASGGTKIQFYVLLPPPANSDAPVLHEVSDVLNLEDDTQRLMVIRISLNMIRIFNAFRTSLPSHVPRLFQTLERPNAVIHFMGNHVRKRCIPAPQAVYQCLGCGQSSSQLPFTVTVTKMEKKKKGDKKVTLFIRPLCIDGLIPDDEVSLKKAVSNVLTALEAFHAKGFVHRDVRWPNILFDEDHWLLSDFELAATANSKVPDGSIRPEFLPPECKKGQLFSAAGDIWQVGQLIKNCNVRNLSDNGVRFSDRLAADTPEDRPSAGQALKDLWL